MFELHNQRAKLVNINPRAEKHGTENVVVADLKFSVDLSNDALDQFDPALKPAFFRKPTKNEAKELFDGTESETPMRVLRFPKMGPIKWDVSLPGYLLAVAYGIREDESALKFAAKEFDQIVFHNKEGGTTNVTFRVIVKPDGEMDELCSMLQSEVEITMTAPAEEQSRLTIQA